MNGRRAAIATGAVLAVGATAWWAVATFAPEVAIDITATQLQARLDTRFPQRNCALMVACVTLSDPHVVLTEGSGRIGLSADVVAALGHREMRGQVAFSGVLRYVRYEGDFYLDDVRLDNFALTGAPPDLVEIVRLRGATALRRALDNHPVYSLKGDGAKTTFARLAVRDVHVVDGKVRVTFLRFGN